MIGLAASLIGSKTGRTAILIALALAGAGILLWRVFAAGKASARADQLNATINAVKEKVQSDEAIRSLSPDARRERLREWVRDARG